MITAGNGVQDGTLLGSQILTHDLWRLLELLPVKCSVQQVVGDLTDYDLIQRGKKFHQPPNDQATIPGGRQLADEVKRMERYCAVSPGPGQFIVGSLHRNWIGEGGEEDEHDLLGNHCFQEETECHGGTEPH